MVNQIELQSFSSGDSDVLLATLCDQYSEALRRGQSVSVDDFVRRYPQLADEIRTAFAAMKLFNAGPSSPRTGSAHTDIDDQPEKIGRFDIVRTIGRGGMGVVYEATHPSVSRRVAIKVLKSELVASESFAARFRLEAEAASRLNHPNIVPFIDYGEANGVAYISMLHIEGESLDHVLERRRDPSLADDESTQFIARDFHRIAQIGACVASALAQAHDQHTIHRDIKPANLILGADGKVWVTDFGLAKLRDAEAGLSCIGDVIGTPQYMAPEQIRGISNERSDIYALGVTLYELAVGVKPWALKNEPGALTQRGLFRPIEEANPDVPPQLARIISKACHSSAYRRYKTAAELQFDLNKFAHGGTFKCRRSLRHDGVRPSKFRDFILATALVGCIVLAALIWLSKTGRLQSGKIDVASTTEASEAPRAYISEPIVVDHVEGHTEIPAIQLTASDPDGGGFSWQLMPSADSGNFVAQRLSGHLCFRDVPAFSKPTDANTDNIYELNLQATDLLQPHLGVFLCDRNTEEIFLSEPATGTRLPINIPRHLLAICSCDGQEFLHTHLSNDGTVALYKSELCDTKLQTTLLKADCHLSPHTKSLAQGPDSTFLCIQQCRGGFELQKMRLQVGFEFECVGDPIPLEGVQEPIGLSCMGYGDYQCLDIRNGHVVLLELAVSDAAIIGSRELPVGWEFRGATVLDMSAWVTASLATTPGPEFLQHIQISVERKSESQSEQ